MPSGYGAFSRGPRALSRRAALAGLASLPLIHACARAAGEARRKQRVLVSTDIGGTDPDDFQSMVHLLLYADTFDIEGLVSSPFGPGRARDILTVIDQYEKDYDRLRTWSADYPEPDALRALTSQGETQVAPYAGVREATDGSRRIIECARRDDPRPLHVLVWGGIEDLAQALHDAPDILPKLRVYFIGGPNKKWSPDAFQYIADNHKKLWIIESNAAYRGFFTGGEQEGEWGNAGFVTHHAPKESALGGFFHGQLGGVLKMGDTPSVARLLHGEPEDPAAPGWGGRYVRAWRRPYYLFEKATTAADKIDEFSVAEFAFPVPESERNAQALAFFDVDNQSLEGHFSTDGKVRFRFSPKGARQFDYRVRSSVKAIDGLSGSITARETPADAASRPDPEIPNWWTDDPDPKWAVGPHIGARTVSRWREDFLADFARRFERGAKAKA